MSKVSDLVVRGFVQEAIECHEHGLNRSAVILSWIGAMYLLYDHVVQSKLKEFNAEAKSFRGNWKDAIDHDGLALMKERDFLDRLQNISVIGKPVKKALIECLDRRNDCAHPNTLKIENVTVAHHISLLLSHVYEPFSN